MRLTAALVAVLGVGATMGVAEAMDMSRAVEQLWVDVSTYPPRPGQMTVCYGFVCRRKYEIAFTAADKAALAAIMAKGKASASAERGAMQKAVVWFDRRLGPVLGTDRRVARADFRFGDDAHNYDCWDTTRNVTGLLVVMQDWGFLKHHKVGDPAFRGNALVGQTPHNTPVVIENGSGTQYVVDLWTRGYGQTPEVMTLADWMPLD